MTDNDPTADDRHTLLRLTADIVTAYVDKTALSPAELVTLIGSVSRSLSEIGEKPATTGAIPGGGVPIPAVPIKKSVTPDYLICLEDGKKLKMLKRHLRTAYGMSLADYRAKWGLPHDYPSVAPNYAARRSSLAKSTGLGRRGAVGRPSGKPGP
jgi:predicted transcriptional regulator